MAKSHKACPRLKTLPVAPGVCPKGYIASRSKTDPNKTCCKREVLIPVRKGTLRRFGYSSKLQKEKRQEALRKAVKADGWLSIFRKLNALTIFFKRNPKMRAIFFSDRDYVKAYGKPGEDNMSKMSKTKKRYARSKTFPKGTYVVFHKGKQRSSTKVAAAA